MPSILSPLAKSFFACPITSAIQVVGCKPGSLLIIAIPTLLGASIEAR